MDHVLSVTLDKSATPWSVDIDQHGNANQVGRNPQRQTLVWQLTGNAASGELLPLQWVETPREGIFGPPEVTANGQRMTMTDLNKGQDSTGTWIYMLSLTLDGQQYSTRTTLPTGTTTNPSIKNH
ncbi:hypothetical protein [Frateuria sp. STR12]|uniref:hypothetical protein n=1 Tax=Frateuria hangzhouensis TaxID=2995589 RepID=UPI002260BA73|nr:hypothetical protein [Frateuria sp. STR12]MCX7512878.1 hypothetical protein [Frateuria sp. STR12]